MQWSARTSIMSWDFKVWFVFPHRNRNRNWSNPFYCAETPEKKSSCIGPEVSGKKQKGEEGVCPAHRQQWSWKPFSQQGFTSEYSHKLYPMWSRAGFHTVSNYNCSVAHSIPKIVGTREANSWACYYFQAFAAAGFWTAPSPCPSNPAPGMRQAVSYKG